MRPARDVLLVLAKRVGVMGVRQRSNNLLTRRPHSLPLKPVPINLIKSVYMLRCVESDLAACSLPENTNMLGGVFLFAASMITDDVSAYQLRTEPAQSDLAACSPSPL